MIKHSFLILPAYTTEVTEKTATVGHHLRKSDFLHKEHLVSWESKRSLLIVLKLRSQSDCAIMCAHVYQASGTEDL